MLTALQAKAVDGVARCSMASVARDVGKGVATVDRAVRSLELAGRLSVTRPASLARGSLCSFTIIPLDRSAIIPPRNDDRSADRSERNDGGVGGAVSGSTSSASSSSSFVLDKSTTNERNEDGRYGVPAGRNDDRSERNDQSGTIRHVLDVSPAFEALVERVVARVLGVLGGATPASVPAAQPVTSAAPVATVSPPVGPPPVVVQPPPRPVVAASWTGNDSEEHSDVARLVAALGEDRVRAGRKPFADVRRAVLYTLERDARGSVKGGTLGQCYGWVLGEGRQTVLDGGRHESFDVVLGGLAGTPLPEWASFLSARPVSPSAGPPSPRARQSEPFVNSPGRKLAALQDEARCYRGTRGWDPMSEASEADRECATVEAGCERLRERAAGMGWREGVRA